MKTTIKIQLILLLIAGFFNQAMAQPGSLDLSFGSYGIAKADNNGLSDESYAIAVQTDGKILVGGISQNNSNNTYASFIVRMKANGTIDSSFGTAGKFTLDLPGQDRIMGLKVQTDGKIVAGGNYISGDGHYYALRLNNNGTFDNTFANNGIDTFSFFEGNIQAVELQSDGKMLLAGSDYTNGNYYANVMRLNTNGRIDSTFGTNGRVLVDVSSNTDDFRSLALQPDGKIVAVGFFWSNNSTNNLLLVRLNSNGTLDNTFSTDGIMQLAGTDYCGYSVKLQVDGKILVGGKGATGQHTDFLVARFLTDGNPDNSFGTNGQRLIAIEPLEDEVRSLSIDSDGKIILVGRTRIPSTYIHTAITRLNTNGSTDSTYGTNGLVVSGLQTIYSAEVTAAHILADNRLLVTAPVYNTTTAGMDFAVARFAADCQAINNALTTSDITLTAVQSNAWYQWVVCDSIFTPVANANTISFTPDTTGNYTVLVNVNGCTDTAACTQVIICTSTQFPIGQFGDTLSTDAGAPYQWINCNTNLPVGGATSSSFIPMVDGSYAVVVDGANNCKDTSECVTVVGVGIHNIPGIKATVYPNPFANYIHVQLKESSSTYTADLLSADGKVLKSVPIKNGEVTIHVADLSPSAYILRIAGNNQMHSLMLVKLLQP